ncbi:hypothetical protein U14_01294 [Candidatus Moduliflexus flocculans]|uniref:Metal dependent phosphohydrolase n=1 Tax=Candidatus Moduliflexus flocculans TaxID=1499966 RepID=A0A0S6VVE2_9BACT|nr:hypothetical protein U14_01294 [Candidatus Moduliflexus flocculans]
MENLDMKRRDFMKFGMVAGGALAAMTMLPKQLFAITSKAITLDNCLQLTPRQMAEQSQLVQASWQELRSAAAGISDATIRNIVQAILDNPAPTFMERYQSAAEKAALRKELIAAGLLDEKAVPENADFPPSNGNPKQSPQPFFSAPGSGYQSHHSYPGGVVTHTNLNVKVSVALFDGYASTYGYSLNKDVVLASQILHDLHKPWVFQWLEDGSTRTELSLAGTGEHHVYGIAESMYRGLPTEVVVAQACAHNHAGSDADEKGVVGWLKAAAILAGKNPAQEGYIAASGDTLPLPRSQEGFICHLGDHDWVLSVPAAKWMIPILGNVAKNVYGMTDDDLKGKRFNQFRNYLFSQATIMNLYQVYRLEGEDSITKIAKQLIAA